MLSKPTHLRCNLFRAFNNEKISSARPSFSWVVNDDGMNVEQFKYHILLSDELEILKNRIGDVWDSTVTQSSQSINVPYTGENLSANKKYYWMVRVWKNISELSPWSEIHSFETTNNFSENKYPGPMLSLIDLPLKNQVKISESQYFYEFEKAVFGTIVLKIKHTGEPYQLKIHLGEDQKNGRVNREPGGTIRYREANITVFSGEKEYVVPIPPDKRNTGNCAILMPKGIIEVLPFRFCEIEGVKEGSSILKVQQRMVYCPFDDQASEFKSSDDDLNTVWDLCKHTIKATTFCGYYVDGDRERIPYEADAYINQLCHYCVDAEYTVARRTHEYLMKTPTWPTEWILHSVLIAWADYWFTGNFDSLMNNYEDLKKKTLLVLRREDGLISTQTGLVTEEVRRSVYLYDKNNSNITSDIKDIVDWPPGSFATDGTGERDNYEMVPINTVVNSFHYQALLLISKIAKILGKPADEKLYLDYSNQVKSAINEKLVENATGLYLDGEGSKHVSLHGNMMPLVFGIVPENKQEQIANYIASRGMVCSVYGAQYLLESLFLYGQGQVGINLMRANDSRSWLNMIRSGATMTMEAWDIRYKKNLDWNHAWGAAPANIIPMYLMGIRPIEAGFKKVLIQPQLGDLRFAKIKFPTIRGPIELSVVQNPLELKYDIEVPATMRAVIYWPIEYYKEGQIKINNQVVNGQIEKLFIIFEIGSGRYSLVGYK